MEDVGDANMMDISSIESKENASVNVVDGNQSMSLDRKKQYEDPSLNSLAMDAAVSGEEAELSELLNVYYQRFYDFGKAFKWLSYGDKEYFANREFSMTLEGDVYCRFLSYSSATAMARDFEKRLPVKFDFGAVYNAKPKDKKTLKASAFVPVERELVFDIDMTDYDDVRTCCQEANVCMKCWPMMRVAVRVLDTALREDFGFHHLLWVFSGRRGIHCWICDRRARSLSQQQRTAIVEYLTVVKGGSEHKARKANLFEMHPSLIRAKKLLEPYFLQLVDSQNWLGIRENWSKILASLPENMADDRRAIESHFSTMEQTSRQRWRAMVQLLHKRGLAGERVVNEIMFEHVYPRLDVNVTKGLNHLLKAPMCIHAKTGKICVPMDHENIDDFDPFKVPRVQQLINELNTYDTRNPGSTEKSYNKTSLKPAMAIFDRFLSGMAGEVSDSHRERREAEANNPMSW